MIREGNETVNQLVSDTVRIHNTYLGALYLNDTLEKRVRELEQENKFLMKTVDEYENKTTE